MVEWETRAYQSGETVLYESDSYPIAVLTDTTERSPTFSLTPFEKSTETEGPFSLCYLSIPFAQTPLESWQKILNRDPIGLEWPEFKGRLGSASILEFDFSRHVVSARAKRLAPHFQSRLEVERSRDLTSLRFSGRQLDSSLVTSLIKDTLAEQILIKLLLNTLSLMVMGKLKRYEGNVMTWVRASNGKLIDRTLRYLEFLMQKRGLKALPREDLIRLVFSARETAGANEAVILTVLENLK